MAQSDTLSALQQVIRERLAADPDNSYVASLYANGLDQILKKVCEESAEVIIAAKGEDEIALVKEVADLWFHCMVLLVQKGLSSEDVLEELNQRFGISGHEEKASRSK